MTDTPEAELPEDIDPAVEAKETEELRPEDEDEDEDEGLED